MTRHGRGGWQDDKEGRHDHNELASDHGPWRWGGALSSGRGRTEANANQTARTRASNSVLANCIQHLAVIRFITQQSADIGTGARTLRQGGTTVPNPHPPTLIHITLAHIIITTLASCSPALIRITIHPPSPTSPPTHTRPHHRPPALANCSPPRLHQSAARRSHDGTVQRNALAARVTTPEIRNHVSRDERMRNDVQPSARVRNLTS
ncbi:hypothetical protein RJ55_05547 [Drechmeria coniospora]|nr:hypothetical protein RJ55_05547 [Drechmeria coniospora]